MAAARATAARSVEGLRNLKLRLQTEKFPGGASESVAALAPRTGKTVRVLLA